MVEMERVGADLGLSISQNPSSPFLFNDNTRKRWSDEMLELMLGHVASFQQTRHQTLDLLSTFSSHIIQHQPLQNPVPYGWERCLDLQTGSVYYVNSKTGTTSADPRSLLANDLNSIPSSSSSSSDSSSDSSFLHNTKTGSPSPGMTNLDLDLRLASLPQKPKPALCHPSSSKHFSSSHDSMVTFQATDADCGENLITEEVCGSGEGGPDMVALGCRKCLMYVMLSSADPRCPRCGTSTLLDIPQSKRTKLIHTI